MRVDADAYSQMSLLDMLPQDQEVVSMSILYARYEGKKIVLYRDKECTDFWAWGEDSPLQQRCLRQTPYYYFTDDNMYTFDSVRWVENG